MRHLPASAAVLIALAGMLSPVCRSAEALRPVPKSATPADIAVDSAQYRRQVEEDWLKRLEVPVTTQSDAAGACDGVKDGKYGFHTGQEANPWWQVDLGGQRDIHRVVIYNRLDYAPGLHNADNLVILTSDDGKAWTKRYANSRHFGGVGQAGPLVVRFERLAARFVRIMVAGDKPIYFHLDEVEVYGAEAGKNLALRRPADQSSLSPWSTAKIRQVRYPTGQVIDSARRLASELRDAGVDVGEHLRRIDDAAKRLASLGTDAPDAEQRKVYLEARWAVRRLVFANPLLGFDRLLFIKRFTQETYPDICLNHMPWVSRPGGDLCILWAGGRPLFAALAEGAGASIQMRQLLNGALGPGHVHGTDLWYDGDRVVFGYARAGSDQPPAGWLDRTQSYRLRREVEPIHIFEVGVDGKGLRQITTGEWSDLDPTYLPSGEIAFVSERCGTSLQCNEFDKDETSCNLYVMQRDGSNIRRLSVNKDGDYLPHTLADGTIGYTRWEYHERSWAFIQSIWTVRPDGTGADAIFKQHFVDPWALEDARSIPGSNKLVAVAAGHHTLAVGPVVVINHSIGINEPAGINIVTPGVRPPEGGMSGIAVPGGGVTDASGFYSTPWPLSERHFLVAYTYGPERDPAGYALYLIDVHGNKELVYRDAGISCFAPMPLRPRPRPPVLPDMTDPAKDHATCLVSNAAFGVEGIDAGRAKYLRIAEPIGWPYDNARGGQRYGEDHGYGGPGAERKNLLSWTPVRVIGTVPVEADGSAHFRVPADTAVYFQLLDENQMELRRMRSFVSFQPGEFRACVGCHETRAISGPGGTTAAGLRPASIPEPPPWGDRPISFLRDIQPVLSRNCVKCHGGLKPAGGLDYSPGLTSYDPNIAGYGHNRAYETIMARQLVAVSAVRQQDASITPPLAYGAHRSRLIEALDGKAHAERVRLTPEERLRLITWIDANAPYHDHFVNKRPERPAYDIAGDGQLLQKIKATHQKRCASCHQTDDVSRPDWIDLHAPGKSLFLAAPLPAGAEGKCTGGYKDASDPDYTALLSAVGQAVQRQWANPRRDLLALSEEPRAAAAASLIVGLEDLPPVQFAGAEIRRACAAGGMRLAEMDLAKATAAKDPLRIFIAGTAAGRDLLMARFALKPPAQQGAQAYAIRRLDREGQTSLFVLGADAAGAMYGGLDLAEAIRLGTLDNVADSEHAPHIAQRGIKFNIPLDARTPSYSDNADAAQQNIPEMWSMDFWREFIDEMARHRYNVLTLWNLHPFPSLVKVPEFPEVALDDVKRTTLKLDDTFSHTGDDMVRPAMLRNLVTDKKMTIDQKILFWRDVMQHARNRGVDVYWFTWNMFVFGADGKHGITAAQDNDTTIAYFRASVREMVLTYPLLAGFGITAGERLNARKDDYDKEKWLWKAYGEGVRDAVRLQPGRQVRMIHRFHMTGQADIVREWKDYPGPFDLSFKYAIAHMYSTPKPPFIQAALPHLKPELRSWLTIRNDDIYSFRWGDPQFAREFIRAIPGPDKIAGFYMGPDGYIWGREFLSTEPQSPRELVISKQWYSFMLWGRLSYEPDLGDDLFKQTIAQRFPEVDADQLMAAWAEASRIVPQITRFFWGDIDLKWLPEACLSHPRHRGWYTVRHFVEGHTMPGSGILDILAWREQVFRKQPFSGQTPIQVADALAGHAAAAMQAAAQMRPRQGDNKELRLTLGDIEALAHLGNYYAEKIRAASQLALFDVTGAAEQRANAVEHLKLALEHWKRYATAYARQYNQPVLYNRVGVVDIPALAGKVAADIDIARNWKPSTYKDASGRKPGGDVPFRP